MDYIPPLPINLNPFHQNKSSFFNNNNLCNLYAFNSPVVHMRSPRYQKDTQDMVPHHRRAKVSESSRFSFLLHPVHSQPHGLYSPLLLVLPVHPSSRYSRFFLLAQWAWSVHSMSLSCSNVLCEESRSLFSTINGIYVYPPCPAQQSQTHTILGIHSHSRNR